MIFDTDPGVRVIQFWTDYKPDGVDADGKAKLKEIDMVEYCQMGGAQLGTNISTVRALSRVRPYVEGSDDIASMQSNMRWAVIKRAYDAWKASEELPLNGIPLEAWAGLSKGHVAVLKQHAVRTVEELAGLNEGMRARIPLPNLARLSETAKVYLLSYEKSKVSEDMTALAEQNKNLQEQLNEMRAMLEAQPKAEPKPPRSEEGKPVRSERKAA